MDDVLAQVEGFPIPDGSHLDLTIRQGDIVRVVGPNGSGKTSLLRALAGLDTPILPAKVTAAACGFAMQHAMDSLVGLTVEGEFRLRDIPTAADVKHLGTRDVATLSSGEARHVALAVARSGRLLLLDEPDEGLDAGRKQGLREMVQRHRRHGAVVLVDHDDAWAHIATQTVVLADVGNRGWAPIDAPGGPDILRMDAAIIRRGDMEIALPAVRFGPGLHLITGPNGCGKTTLLRHLAGLGTDGSVHPMLPARSGDLLWHDTVAAALHGVATSVRSLVSDHLLPRSLWSLSGGEAQRVALARILGRSSPVHLLDEPEAHLDGDGRGDLHAILTGMVEEGGCVIVASHDLGWRDVATTITDLGGMP